MCGSATYGPLDCASCVINVRACIYKPPACLCAGSCEKLHMQCIHASTHVQIHMHVCTYVYKTCVYKHLIARNTRDNRTARMHAAAFVAYTHIHLVHMHSCLLDAQHCRSAATPSCLVLKKSDDDVPAVPDPVTRQLSGLTGGGIPGIENRYVDVIAGTDSRYNIDGRYNVEAASKETAGNGNGNGNGSLASPGSSPRRKMPNIGIIVPEVRAPECLSTVFV
jgi:hypothetical protein